MSGNQKASSSWNPEGQSRLVVGFLYFYVDLYLYYIFNFEIKGKKLNSKRD
jgi:hypothetical protein